MQVTRPPTGGRLTTYARKKGRSRVLQTSPARATNGEDISMIEMAHRMQKRAWQSMNSAWPVLERDLTNQEKISKRPKNAHAVVSTFSSDSDGTRPSPVFPIDSLTSLTDETNNVQYKTPFNLSPVSSPTTPDSMSPVPPSRRHISGTASRNLKENRSDIRLASPFHSCSVSKACSRSGSRTNSPKKMVKKPPFYIKARTRSETNAHPGESIADEVPFPGSGSLPTLGSMKAPVCDHHPADVSTVYMLQNLSKQDWFTPAKALSRSSFPEDYTPPGTPFQEWDYSTEPFLGGIPLQTSTPNVVKDVVRRHISIDAAPNPPPSRALDGVNHNTKNSFDVGGSEHGRRYQRHFNHDSIFSSSFDASKTFCTSIIRPNCMNTERFPQDDSALLTAYSSDPGKAVINLSGMLDCLDIDGMQADSPNLVQRSRSLDSTQNTGPNSSPSAACQTAGRRRDRASTIRASDYITKAAISLPSGGETSASVSALTTRTRSGTIRPVRPPMTSASGFPVVAPQSCAGQEQTQGGTSEGPQVIVCSDKELLGSPGPSQGNPRQAPNFSRAQRTKHMTLQVHDDESDDELLLDDRGWNWDGSWD